MSIKKLLPLLGISIFVAGCATTEPTIKYSGNTEYARMEQNESPTETGVRYLLGRGVKQNDAKAFEYFYTAAEDNDPFAQNEIAYMYAAGKGTQQNYAKAVEYYQKAANHGLASAQYNLGLLYANGLGTEQNNQLAQQWFQKSAKHGFEPAKKALAEQTV